MKELKYLLRRDKQEAGQHLLESEDFRKEFYGGELDGIASASTFRVNVG